MTLDIAVVVNNLLHFSKRKITMSSQQIGERLNKISKLAKSVLVDHKAYLRAAADKKSLNIDSFRKDIMKELSDDEDEDGTDGPDEKLVLKSNISRKQDRDDEDNNAGGSAQIIKVGRLSEIGNRKLFMLFMLTFYYQCH